MKNRRFSRRSARKNEINAKSYSRKVGFRVCRHTGIFYFRARCALYIASNRKCLDCRYSLEKSWFARIKCPSHLTWAVLFLPDYWYFAHLLIVLIYYLFVVILGAIDSMFAYTCCSIPSGVVYKTFVAGLFRFACIRLNTDRRHVEACFWGTCQWYDLHGLRWQVGQPLRLQRNR